MTNCIQAKNHTTALQHLEENLQPTFPTKIKKNKSKKSYR